jgi:uncharacterized protein GlcG (DUF336 family)
MLRGDGVGLHTPEGADRKACTARTFGTSSADFVKRMLNDPTSLGSKEYSRLLAIEGGLPIKVGDDVVGAVGVSGSPGREDECSQPGIDNVAAYLKFNLRTAKTLGLDIPPMVSARADEVIE